MEQPPKFMTVGAFCAFSGLSRWHFMRMCDRYHLTLIPKGMSKLVNVQEAMTIMELHVPRLVASTTINRPDRMRDLINKLRAAIEPEQEAQPPVDVA